MYQKDIVPIGIYKYKNALILRKHIIYEDK